MEARFSVESLPRTTDYAWPIVRALHGSGARNPPDPACSDEECTQDCRRRLQPSVDGGEGELLVDGATGDERRKHSGASSASIASSALGVFTSRRRGRCRMTPATLTNPERALSRFVDPASRPEVDSERIGLFGCSMSSYWGRDQRFYVQQDGRVTRDTAYPTWWLDARPAQIAERVRAHQAS